MPHHISLTGNSYWMRVQYMTSRAAMWAQSEASLLLCVSEAENYEVFVLDVVSRKGVLVWQHSPSVRQTDTRQWDRRIAQELQNTVA